MKPSPFLAVAALFLACGLQYSEHPPSFGASVSGLDAGAAAFDATVGPTDAEASLEPDADLGTPIFPLDPSRVIAIGPIRYTEDSDLTVYGDDVSAASDGWLGAFYTSTEGPPFYADTPGILLWGSGSLPFDAGNTKPAVNNFSVTGQSCATMIGNAPALVHAHHNKHAATLYVQCGLQDGREGADPATTCARIQTLASDAVAAGWSKVYAGGLLDSPALAPGYASAVNDCLREASWGAAHFVDVAADPFLGLAAGAGGGSCSNDRRCWFNGSTTSSPNGSIRYAWFVETAIAGVTPTKDPGVVRDGRLFLRTSMPMAPAMPGVVLDNLVFDGDSMTGEYNDPEDGGTTSQYQTWAEDTCEILGSSVRCANVASGGFTGARLIARASTFVDDRLVAGKTNVLVFQFGVNDVDFTVVDGGVALIESEYLQYADARHAAGWQRVFLIGPESNAYFDPLYVSYSGVSLWALDTVAKALFPARVDGYLRLNGDRMLGVVDGGSASGYCDYPPVHNASSWNSECYFVDARLHKTVSADAYGSQLTARALVAMPGF